MLKSFRAITIYAFASSILFVSSTAWASDRIALLIGNSSYTSLPELKNPRHDHDLMVQALEALNFQIFGGKDLTFVQMRDELVEFMRSGGDAEVALVYFAGHGVQVDGENYLMPVDAEIRRPSDLSRFAISANPIVEDLEELATHKILVLDACRDNPFASPELKVRNGLAEMAAGPNTRILYATQPGNVALDGVGSNSPFTMRLAEQIKAENTAFSDIVQNVTRDVLAATANKQLPWLSGGTSSKLFLNSKSSENEEIVWNVAMRYDQPELYLIYLSEYPNGLYAEEAKRQIGLTNTEPKSRSSASPPQEDVAALDNKDQFSKETDLKSPEAQSQDRNVPMDVELPGTLDVLVARSDELKLNISISKMAQIKRRLKLLGYDPDSLTMIIFGGDRAEFKEWQNANGFSPTGYLNKLQLAELMRQSDEVYSAYVASKQETGRTDIPISEVLNFFLRNKSDVDG